LRLAALCNLRINLVQEEEKPATKRPCFLVTGSAFSLWLCRRLNFAAPRLVTMLFQPNGLVALFAAISRGQAIPKSTSLETGAGELLCFWTGSPLPLKRR
jgi:hypothetical protein